MLTHRSSRRSSYHRARTRQNRPGAKLGRPHSSLIASSVMSPAAETGPSVRTLGFGRNGARLTAMVCMRMCFNLCTHLWNKFTQLSRLQLRILQRAMRMLRQGGRIVYSTCSLNPVENEAVVAEALRTVPGKLPTIRVRTCSCIGLFRVRVGRRIRIASDPHPTPRYDTLAPICQPRHAVL